MVWSGGGAKIGCFPTHSSPPLPHAQVLATLQEAQRAMSRGDYTGSAGKWDAAWALYHGRDSACAPYSRADKRGADFGRVLWDGVTSLQNVAIGQAFRLGQQAIAQSALTVPAQSATLSAAVSNITKNVQVTHDAKVANRNAKVWHGATEKGP
jgi:hypothetical protein